MAALRLWSIMVLVVVPGPDKEGEAREAGLGRPEGKPHTVAGESVRRGRTDARLGTRAPLRSSATFAP